MVNNKGKENIMINRKPITVKIRLLDVVTLHDVILSYFKKMYKRYFYTNTAVGKTGGN
ncbi:MULTISPECIES: hypothetical protein [Bacillaceae]|uniref:Uncharacterized protein n=1 Tax=Niallia alba TaxID=2729105 RepID=A0A7Y0PPA6_9BACI|nr:MULTISPECIES: hypothetical protein [Bacillaceae]MCB5238778.1 hypothetical protein [Niallia circulans]NMO78304.1 hypothetical protein [Niallia alba]